MSGEGLSVSFKRTKDTTKSNRQLLAEFRKLVYSSNKVMSHLKWYGEDYSVEIREHGDEELQKWQQEDVAIKDSFQFCISVYDSWYDDANYFECHKTEYSFVWIARKFAQENNLMYFPEGFPAEWIEQEIIDGEKNWNHFKVKPDDKNIDKICELWYDYGISNLEQERINWNQAKESIKKLMNKEKCVITQQ
jgi:hypothetical protein